MYRILIILLFAFFVSCGPQRKLQKSYVGKPESVLKEKFGNPITVLDREAGKVYVYEKIKQLRSTEINQGKLALDPMVSPMVEKTERYYFTIKDGKISDVKLEEEYER